MTPETRPVRLRNYLAYGSNDVLGAGSMAVISGWVLIFYTQFCGLSAGQAATIFAVARILDAFASPMIGYISDHFGRTRLGQRFGRRRFFRCRREAFATGPRVCARAGEGGQDPRG